MKPGLASRLKTSGRGASLLLSVLATPAIVAVDHFVSSTSFVAIKPLLYLLIISISLALIIYQWFIEKHLGQANNVLKSKIATLECRSYVLAQISRLNERKVDCIRQRSYWDSSNTKDGNGYSVHQYLRECCKSLEDVIAHQLCCDVSNVDVSLIYRYVRDPLDSNWKWIIGRSSLSNNCKLNDFIDAQNTLYHNLIYGQCDNPIFCNDKSSSDIYREGRRDKLFGGRGSFFAIQTELNNVEDELIDSVLLVSTYGVNFVSLDSGSKSVDEFKQLLSNQIIPPYISLLQAEFAQLYMRHFFG